MNQGTLAAVAAEKRVVRPGETVRMVIRMGKEPHTADDSDRFFVKLAQGFINDKYRDMDWKITAPDGFTVEPEEGEFDRARISFSLTVPPDASPKDYNFTVSAQTGNSEHDEWMAAGEMPFTLTVEKEGGRGGAGSSRRKNKRKLRKSRKRKSRKSRKRKSRKRKSRRK
tara:strand:- start:2320 stop:2826 length:507 start_codon:yes stop_codon:yes gene_type:complete